MVGRDIDGVEIYCISELVVFVGVMKWIVDYYMNIGLFMLVRFCLNYCYYDENVFKWFIFIVDCKK